jgi:pimeloyl-ACP methyl ester carboxylesterase
MRLRRPRRTTALTRMERIAAVTHLVASLEYLARPRDRRRGGLNNWEISGRAFHARSPKLGRVLDVIANRRATTALHALRIPAALSLLAPLPGRARLAANAALTGTSVALYPRQHYGTDGSDQVSFLVQGVSTVARAFERRPHVVDAGLWYVALQSVLSYAASGWAKLAGSSWRSGDALAGVMRTRTYGDPLAWRLCNSHPRAARLLGSSVLALECVFPIVFLARGRAAAPMLASATGFHLANARLMGLGRFVWSFLSMHPAVLYATGPRELTDRRGKVIERRDDTLPALSATMGAGALAAALVAQGRRRSVVLEGRGDERTLATSSGNTLAYRTWGPPTRGPHDNEPLIVLECGLLSTAEHWEWIAKGLAERFPTITYSRAGYGPSRYGAGDGYRLDIAVRDLIELLEHVKDGRRVVVAGHSLGGYLAMRAAAEAPGLVDGVGFVDSSHPGELQRSSRQAQGQEVLTRSLSLMPISLSLGLGALLARPEWVDAMPESARRTALAEYRDPRLWAAGKREWQATVEEFAAFEGRLPRLDVPALVLTAGFTDKNDPIQRELHQELADAAPRAEQHVIEGADHDQLMTSESAARRVVEHLVAFADGLASETREVHADAHSTR